MTGGKRSERARRDTVTRDRIRAERASLSWAPDALRYRPSEITPAHAAHR